jgi:transglutaminase-like putative cysteine protease
MLRPRESRDLRLISSNVMVTPAAVVTWANDVFGNAVATATFQTMSTEVVIDSVAELRLEAVAWPVFDIAASAISYPFRYSDGEWTDLGAMALPQYPDGAGRLRTWARQFVRSNPTDTLALLKGLNSGIAGTILYQSREEEGTQSPIETLDRGWGSCRDFAVLFAEATRTLDSVRGSFPATSTIAIDKASDREMRVRPTLGQKSTCPARAGSRSIQQIAVSGAST